MLLNEREEAVRVLPSGYPRLCCGENLPFSRLGNELFSPRTVNASAYKSRVETESRSLGGGPGGRANSLEDHTAFFDKLAAIVGAKNCLVTPSETQPYCTGARLGHGTALVVCLPRTLSEAVAVLRACVDEDVAVLPQVK